MIIVDFMGLHDMYVVDYQIIHYQLIKELPGEDSDRYFFLIVSERRFNEVRHDLTDDCIDLAG